MAQTEEQKKDLGTLRVKYAAYLRKMMANPDTATQALSFKDWLRKKRNEKNGE